MSIDRHPNLTQLFLIHTKIFPLTLKNSLTSFHVILEEFNFRILNFNYEPHIHLLYILVHRYVFMYVLAAYTRHCPANMNMKHYKAYQISVWFALKLAFSMQKDFLWVWL